MYEYDGDEEIQWIGEDVSYDDELLERDANELAPTMRTTSESEDDIMSDIISDDQQENINLRTINGKYKILFICQQLFCLGLSPHI